jgi:hypothetical protein
MKLEPITEARSTTPKASGSLGTAPSDNSFEPLLESILQSKSAQSQQASPLSPLPPNHSVMGTPTDGIPARPWSLNGPRRAAAAYQQQSLAPASIPKPDPSAAASSGPTSAYQKYKDDQLLRNPGGDQYDLGNKRVETDQAQHKSWWGRINKDLSDSFGNLKNLCNNFLFGAKFCYRTQTNEIRESARRGLMGSMVDFFKNLGSAFTFGQWRPDGSPKPEGFWERLKFFGSHVIKAVSRDLFDGVCGSVNQMAGDLALAGWNLVEVLPDTTIGSLDTGRKLTATIFDNGQVLVEYLTDIMPAGEAWLRVHAPSIQEGKLPVVYNLGMPEHFSGDARWEYIRNTPFRKTIETIGALLADVAIAVSTGQINFTSDNAPKRTLP